MGKGNKVDFDETLALQLYRKGLGWHAIGRALGISCSKVKRYFDSIGYKCHNSIGRNRSFDEKRALELKARGVKQTQIAKMLNVHDSTISIFLKSRGIK